MHLPTRRTISHIQVNLLAAFLTGDEEVFPILKRTKHEVGGVNCYRLVESIHLCLLLSIAINLETPD